MYLKAVCGCRLDNCEYCTFEQVRRIREGWPAEEVPLHGPAAKDTPQAEVKASPEASKGLGAQGAQPPARWWPSFLPPRQPQPVGTAA